MNINLYIMCNLYWLLNYYNIFPAVQNLSLGSKIDSSKTDLEKQVADDPFKPIVNLIFRSKIKAVDEEIADLEKQVANDPVKPIDNELGGGAEAYTNSVRLILFYNYLSFDY